MSEASLQINSVLLDAQLMNRTTFHDL